MNNKQKGILAIILASVFWGLATPMVKYALVFISPLVFVFLRMILAIIFMSPFILPKIRGLKVKLKDIPCLLLAGFTGVTLNIGFYFLGLDKTTVIDSSILLSTTSVFTALAGIILLREKLKIHVIGGIIISFFGTIIIVIQPILENGFFRLENSLGNIFILLSMLTWVVYTILNKEINKIYDSLTIVYLSFLIGAISFLPFALKTITHPEFYLNLPITVIAILLFETIFATICSYVLFTYGVKHVSAAAAGVIQYINPIVAISASILFLGEKITWPFIVGAILIIGGIFLAETMHEKHPLHKFLQK